MQNASTHPIHPLRAAIQSGKDPTRLTGLGGTAMSYLFALLAQRLDRPCLAVLPGKKQAEQFFQELQFFMAEQDNHRTGGPRRLYLLPPYDISPLSGLSPHREIVNLRIEALYALTSADNPVVVTSQEVLLYKLVPKGRLIQALEYLAAGEEIDREQLLRHLEICGYQRVSLVEERGDYAVRGGVLDIFPPSSPLPIRLELWGDHLESIRLFEPLSQRSEGAFDEWVLLPNTEIIMDEAAVQRARSMGRLPPPGAEGSHFPGQEAWLNHFYPGLDSLFDYLPADTLIAHFDPQRLQGGLKRMTERFQLDLERFREESVDKGLPFPETEGLIHGGDAVLLSLNSFQRLEVNELDLQTPGPSTERDGVHFQLEGTFGLDTDPDVQLAGQGRGSLAPLANKIALWLSRGGRVIIVSRTAKQANRLVEILSNYDVSVLGTVDSWEELPESPGLWICLGRLGRGFLWPAENLYIISEDEIFGQKRGRSRNREKARENALSWSTFSQLKQGDLVVHEEHGIGRYGGLLKMEIQNRVNDFILIEYANADKLYIPADRVSSLQTYVGADEVAPRLDQLGGRSWNIAKEKARKSVKRIAKQLVQLYALRRYRSGYAFSNPDHYYREFEATFEHEETPDQIKAIDDVLDDMTSERPMDRLICGDVGFGKTEVALRAAFKAVADGKQVALLVPTTVLAEQHYQTFTKRLSPYGIGVGLLSRFKPPSEQREVLAKVRSDKIQVLIGTHRLLQKDVSFMDLGLLIIDEEQRFGVKQKEALKKYRSMVDVLAITATPIPRTLQMSLMGVRDLSVIETAPEDRLAIQTYLSPFDENLIARAVRFEIERHGQVFFVHNRVQTIDMVAERLGAIVPEARIAVAHGQMKEKDLESTMLTFLRKELDVLVCSTIIESGLDIPSANTIIINEAERLGLAQIYQLRGRVGRSKEKAYAYLLISDGTHLTREAEKRLKALMDFSHLGAGLHLALHDLKIRGAGNILGFAQSGQIATVGYELYLRMIEQAVAEFKGEEWLPEINPEILVDMEAYLPEDYIMDTDVRLNLYRRLSILNETRDLENVEREMVDRFGKAPPPVENLLWMMRLRIFAKHLGIARLEVGTDSVTLHFDPDRLADPAKLVQRIGTLPKRYRFLGENRLRILMGPLTLPEDRRRIMESLQILRSDHRTAHGEISRFSASPSPGEDRSYRRPARNVQAGKG
ncbi:Transcription-repair-coupling factor [uncultured Desulfatiglans sp.]|nr:Transcription-repair-coupling factor [uncultured Desulfatiglans sp.]